MIELGQTNARKHFLGLDDRLYILFAISLAEIDIIIAILLNSPQQIVLAMHLGESLKVLFILIWLEILQLFVILFALGLRTRVFILIAIALVSSLHCLQFQLLSLNVIFTAVSFSHSIDLILLLCLIRLGQKSALSISNRKQFLPFFISFYLRSYFLKLFGPAFERSLWHWSKIGMRVHNSYNIDGSKEKTLDCRIDKRYISLLGVIRHLLERCSFLFLHICVLWWWVFLNGEVLLDVLALVSHLLA